MSPKKFFKYIVKVKNRMTYYMALLSYLGAFLIMELTEWFNWSTKTCAVVMLLFMIAHYAVWKLIIINPVDNRLFHQLDERIIMENKELVKLLVDHKVTLPCHLGPVIEELNKLQPKDM